MSRNRMWGPRRPKLVLAAAMLAVAGSARAESIDTAIAAAKPIVDVRLRYERVEQPVTAIRTEEVADALTMRLRAGFETGKAWDTGLLVEGEFVDAWISDYNSTANGRTQFPIVGDPRASELNRLQLTNTSLKGVTVTLGRQRINLDDTRFVGNVGWRQNEQTFDALRVVTKTVKNLTLDLTWANRVNRVFGENSITQLPKFKGDVVLANLGWDTPLGKLSGFSYQLDLTNADANSSVTRGLRFAGQKPLGAAKVNYVASWATQKDYADNPLHYDVDYLLGELGVAFAGFTGTVGYESLGGDGSKGFATPLATLHRFQGWADVFLTTPAGGIDDTYVGLAWAGKTGRFDAVSATAVWHDFESEDTSAGLGEELDLQLSARVKRLTATLKYADYTGPTRSADVKKFWVELSAAW